MISGEDDEGEETEEVTEEVPEPTDDGIPPPIKETKTVVKLLTPAEARRRRRAKRRAIRRAMRRAYDASVGDTALDLVPGVKTTLFLLDTARKLYRMARGGDPAAREKWLALLNSPEERERKIAEAAKRFFGE